MIRRSTLVFLTCLGALGIPALFANSAVAENPILIAQTSDAVTSSVLSIGSRGRAVRSLQDRLAAAGYYDGAIDGMYGLATQRAVVAFQEEQGFEPTGRLDDPTWEALEAYEAQTFAQTPPPDSEAAAAPAVPPSSAGDVPPPGTSTDTSTGTPIAAESGSSNLGKLLGFGIGGAALLASFGVGFLLANRKKADAEDDFAEGEEWGEAGLDESSLKNGSDSVTVANSNGSSSVSAVTSLNPTDFNPAGFNSTGFNPDDGGAQNGSSSVSSDISQVAAARSGQLGSTVAMTSSDVFEGLLKDLHNPDPHQRRKVIWELGQRGNSLAVQPLVDAMIDADSKEKSLVLAALSEIGMRSLRPMNRALAIALKDDNPEVRKNAIRDLTRIYELVVQISQMLGHAQEDEDPEVRQTAAWALEQLNRIRQTQDLDSNMRSSLGGASPSLPTANATVNSPTTSRFVL